MSAYDESDGIVDIDYCPFCGAHCSECNEGPALESRSRVLSRHQMAQLLWKIRFLKRFPTAAGSVGRLMSKTLKRARRVEDLTP